MMLISTICADWQQLGIVKALYDYSASLPFLRSQLCHLLVVGIRASVSSSMKMENNSACFIALLR